MNVTSPASETIKCVVWDLDQTIWRGVLLEDGAVSLREEVRAVILELDSRGILHSVASRNERDHALMWLARFDIADCLVFPQIGWGRKSDAVRTIADQLGFAYRTIAFVDDQPAERAEVAYHLPEVRCYPAKDAATLPARPEFMPAVVTEDSRRRRVMYQSGVHRAAARAAFTGPDEDFLRSLDLRLAIYRATENDLVRVEELTLRTSQMNATGVHYSATTLRRLLANQHYEVLVSTLDDRFGPHGAVGIVLLQRHPSMWHVRLLATSCRVVPFGVGSTLLRWLTDQAATAGVHLVADLRRTGRNRMMEVTYRFAGFTIDRCPCLTVLPAEEGLLRLHLVATAQGPSTTTRVLAPALRGGHRR